MLNENLYLEFVMNEAKKINKFFLLDSGEGDDCIDPNNRWYIEDFSGWLVDEDKKYSVIKSKDNGSAYHDFADNYVFAKWTLLPNGKLIVNFEKC